jgi:translation initiation factor IF-2
MHGIHGGRRARLGVDERAESAASHAKALCAPREHARAQGRADTPRTGRAHAGAEPRYAGAPRPREPKLRRAGAALRRGHVVQGQGPGRARRAERGGSARARRGPCARGQGGATVNALGPRRSEVALSRGQGPRAAPSHTTPGRGGFARAGQGAALGSCERAAASCATASRGPRRGHGGARRGEARGGAVLGEVEAGRARRGHAPHGRPRRAGRAPWPGHAHRGKLPRGEGRGWARHAGRGEGRAGASAPGPDGMPGPNAPRPRAPRAGRHGRASVGKMEGSRRDGAGAGEPRRAGNAAPRTGPRGRAAAPSRGPRRGRRPSRTSREGGG